MTRQPGRPGDIIRLSLLIVGVVGFAAFFAVQGVDGLAERFESVADSPWGIVGFVALYAVVVVLAAPGTIATISAGVLFGFRVGLPVALVGATIGASLAFGVARRVGSDGAHALLGGRLQSVDEYLSDRAFMSVLVLRLLPIVPFNGLNYAAGLSTVRFRAYLPATALGILPGTALTTFTASRALSLRGPSTPVSVALAAAVLLSVAAGHRIVSRRLIDTRTKTERQQSERRHQQNEVE